MHHEKLDNFSFCCKFSIFLEQQNFAGDLGHRIFNVFSLLKREYYCRFVSLSYFRVIIKFKTIYTFLEQRFDEEEHFALLEHLNILRNN
jgi:hypothetical protein